MRYSHALTDAGTAEPLPGNQVVKQCIALLHITSQLLGNKGGQILQHTFFTATGQIAMSQGRGQYISDLHGFS